ncbi:flagellar hook-length control protein FliK [Massilia sp. DWR3-1-1]|uniref:flagellar hook-length control protein FliK n=1 Tax=Massilia sp. DWR3-1-1 TaxID=2804559 RepID=UPI003CF9FA25
MLPRIDASIGPVTPARPLQAAEAIGDPRQVLFERSLQTLVGKSLPGQIMSRLTDGSFVVKVNGTPARMMLPAGSQPGAEVPLTLVSLTPRPTFQIAAFGAGGAAMMSEADAGVLAPPRGDAPAEGEAAPAAGAGKGAATGAQGAVLRGNAAMVAAEQLPALQADSRQAVLSPSARVITNVLATAMAMPNPPTAVHSAAPILARAPVEAQTAALAGELKHTIDSSGLFYESHLRQWSEGKRPLSDLAREPQMQKALEQAPARAGAGAAIDGPTAQFINLQLSSHEQSRVAWQGELFPGQPMQWEISKDAPEARGQGGQQAPTAWRSAVRFRFAHLGEVNAQLVLVGDQLHLQVRAASVDAGAALQAHAPRLAGALEAAGAPLSSLNIAADA